MTLQESMLQILQTNTINSTPWTLADCILRLGPRLAKMSITELAHQCNVSEPTVSRFVVAAGFRNYTDMRDSARKEKLALKSSGFHIPETKLSLVKNEPREYLNFFGRELNRTMTDFINNADISLFDQLAQAIHHASRVFIFCFSSSRLIANIIQTDLARYGKIIYVPSTSDEQVIEAKQLRQGDLAIAISTYGYFVSKFSATIDIISNSPADTALFTQNPGIPETYLFKSVYAVTKTNNPITGSYILLLATEFLVRRYAETIGDDR